MKVAIVTGGNKGIGLAITKDLLKNNYKVIVGARSTYTDEMTKNDVYFIKGDLRKYENHEKLVDFAINNFGSLDLYVNNLGISEWKPIEKINENFLNKLFSTNLYSAFWGCKACKRKMRKDGSIINISSIACKRGSKNNSAYVATKFALNGMTQSLAKEFGKESIRVNAICPVLIKTEGLLSALMEDDSPVETTIETFFEQFTKSQTALNRLPTGNEVAKMVTFLASNNASAITGQCINIDCGVFPQ